MKYDSIWHYGQADGLIFEIVIEELRGTSKFIVVGETADLLVFLTEPSPIDNIIFFLT